MFKKILVPVDGSSFSEQAIHAARELLTGGAEEATLLTISEAPKATRRRRKGLRRPVLLATMMGSAPNFVLPADPPVYAETKDQAVERREQELLEYVNQAGRPLAETGRCIHAAVHFGDPAVGIIDFAQRGEFDLIVMATHGRSGLCETMQGSVTAEVIRSGVSPVLVVRPKKRPSKARR